VQAGGLTNVLAIAAGYYYSLAVKGDGTVWEWGCSAFGQSGPRTYTCRETPAQVTWLTGVEKVALPMGGGPGLALRGDGTAWGWGGFQGGQTAMARSVPSQLGGLSGVVAVSGGLALKSDGAVWGWDAPFTSGWVGRSMPYQVSGLSGVVAITSGSTGYNLAMKNDGTVWSVLGPSAVYRVPNLTGVAAVAASESHALAAKRDGTVWEWSGVESAPIQVSELSGVAAVAVAFEWWWGYDPILIRSSRSSATGRSGRGTGRGIADRRRYR
jgi:alpha-tubulin suppressor-like RCC1 family protein